MSPPLTAIAAATDDPTRALELLETQLLNRRAQRHSQGDVQRHIVRAVGFCMLLGLMALVFGGLWYAENYRHPGRAIHPSARLTAPPAPAASTQPADPGSPRRPRDH